MNNLPKRAAAFVKERREACNLSQSDLSRLSGYQNGQFVSNIERGLAGIPPKILPKMAQILKVAPEEIVALLIQDYADNLKSEVQITCQFFGVTYEKSADPVTA